MSLLEYLPPVSQAQANLAPELTRIHRNAKILIDDLDELERVLVSGELETRLERLSSTVDEIDTLRVTVDDFVVVPVQDIVSPIRETYSNLRGAPYSLVIFCTPAVLPLPSACSASTGPTWALGVVLAFLQATHPC